MGMLWVEFCGNGSWDCNCRWRMVVGLEGVEEEGSGCVMKGVRLVEVFLSFAVW